MWRPGEGLAVCPDGTVLLNPTESELSRAMGMIDVQEYDELFDVMVVGGGPAGPGDVGLRRIGRLARDAARLSGLWRSGGRQCAD